MSPPTIDLLVAYTPQAKSAAGNIYSLIASCEQSTNEILSNSGNSARVDVVHSVEVDYEEEGVEPDVDELQDNDGYDNLDILHSLRNQYGADVVALLIKDVGPYLGIVYEVEAQADEAFLVVKQHAALDDYVFAHEVAHIVGCRHQNDSLGTYQHAYRRFWDGWETVVTDYVATTRIPYWSNPNKTYGGIPLGTYSSNDNARKWNTRAATVAGFKQPQPPSVTISGPTTLGYREVGSWTANVSGGAPPYSYAWRYRYWGSGSWSGVIDSDSQYSRTMLTQDFELQCTVTTSQGLDGDDTHYVTYENFFAPSAELTGDIPAQPVVGQSYPNPFNPSMEISYGVAEHSHVTLEIFNIRGQKIRTVTDEQKAAGYHTATWDGKDAFGNDVASGVYVYRIRVRPVASDAQLFEAFKKMTLVR